MKFLNPTKQPFIGSCGRSWYHVLRDRHPNVHAAQKFVVQTHVQGLPAQKTSRKVKKKNTLNSQQTSFARLLRFFEMFWCHGLAQRWCQCMYVWHQSRAEVFRRLPETNCEFRQKTWVWVDILEVFSPWCSSQALSRGQCRSWVSASAQQFGTTPRPHRLARNIS